MPNDPTIPRKWRLRASGQQNVFVWGRQERSVHTIMKAMIWALYLPQYPHITVEVRIGDRYKPDLVAYAGDEIAPAGIHTAQIEPLFWGEAGQVGRDKIHSLVRRYTSTHFALAKWDADLRPYADLVRDALDGVQRAAPFDLLRIPPDVVKRFVDEKGAVSITHADLEWLRL
jgi:hypothetical protein